MKTLGCAGVLLLWYMSGYLAYSSGSTGAAWVIGYLTAVAVTNVDRYLFAKWLAK